MITAVRARASWGKASIMYYEFHKSGFHTSASRVLRACGQAAIHHSALTPAPSPPGIVSEYPSPPDADGRRHPWRLKKSTGASRMGSGLSTEGETLCSCQQLPITTTQKNVPRSINSPKPVSPCLRCRELSCISTSSRLEAEMRFLDASQRVLASEQIW